MIQGPQVVAFGSSRVWELSTAVVGTQRGDFYNAGLAAATVEDYIVLWSVLKSNTLAFEPDLV